MEIKEYSYDEFRRHFLSLFQNSKLSDNGCLKEALDACRDIMNAPCRREYSIHLAKEIGWWK